MKANRNDPCPCGSGKKYKNCHGQKTIGRSLSMQLTLILLAVVVLVAVLNILGTFEDRSPTTQNRRAAQPGPAPPGKVWSPEHGHWHDAPEASVPGGTGSTAQQPAPTQNQLPGQPPGPAPPGKVWSPEHGHWHDAPPKE